MISQKGFTLIELVVALALFVLVLDIVASIFVLVVRHQKNILNQQQAVNEVSFALERISLHLRNAKASQTVACLPNPQNVYVLTHPNVATGLHEGIKFIDSDGACHEFFIENGIFKERVNNGQVQPLLSGNTALAAFVINGDPKIPVARSSDLAWPKVTLSLQNFQTTITWRNYE